VIAYFFFFQAEDGIRDRNVTGVQTCALPISQNPNLASFLFIHTKLAKFGFCVGFCGKVFFKLLDVRATVALPLCQGGQLLFKLRSEERRVGKECRSRWWRCGYRIETEIVGDA